MDEDEKTAIRPGQTDVVLLSQEEQVSQLVVNAVENLWEVVNELTRLRQTRKSHYYASIFGSARINQGSEPYEQVKSLAARLALMDVGVITGGGPGLMQAANEGIASTNPEALQHSLGIRIDLPHETEGNPFIGKAYQHKTFFSRLHQFVIASDAFIVVPGGVGTLLELSMIWQLLQVRKLYDTPLILVGEMWKELVVWARASMLGEDHPLASKLDLDIPVCVESADEAIALIKKHKFNWDQTHN